MADQAQPKAPKLFDRIGTHFDDRKQNGVEGLKLLDECIRRTASKDRDWDALARFVTLAARSGQAGRVKKIIRCAFGDKIKYASQAKHPAGGTFVMGWDGAFPLKGQNTYTMITKAIEDGVNWDDNKFQKALTEMLPEPIKAAPKVDDKAKAAAAKHLYDYVSEKVKAGMVQGELLDRVMAMLRDNPIVSPNKGEPNH